MAVAAGARKRPGNPRRGRDTVFNALGFDAHRGCVVLPDWLLPPARATADGREIPTQKTSGKASWPRCRCPPWARLPYALPLHGAAASLAPRRGAALTADGAVLQNAGDVRARVRRQAGEITSFVHWETGREFAAGPMNAPAGLYKDVPRLFDAWDIDSNYRECGFVTPAVRVHGRPDCRRRASRAVPCTWTRTHAAAPPSAQTISVQVGGRRVVTFDTTVDWHELHRLLKVELPRGRAVRAKALQRDASSAI